MILIQAYGHFVFLPSPFNHHSFKFAHFRLPDSYTIERKKYLDPNVKRKLGCSFFSLQFSRNPVLFFVNTLQKGKKKKRLKKKTQFALIILERRWKPSIMKLGKEFIFILLATRKMKRKYKSILFYFWFNKMKNNDLLVLCEKHLSRSMSLIV